MIIETDRLYMRRLTEGDFDALCKILQDEKCMYAYEHAFSDEEVREWLCKQLAKKAARLSDSAVSQFSIPTEKALWKWAIFSDVTAGTKAIVPKRLKSAKTLPLINLAQTRCIPLFVTATQLQGVLPRKTA